MSTNASAEATSTDAATIEPNEATATEGDNTGAKKTRAAVQRLTQAVTPGEEAKKKARAAGEAAKGATVKAGQAAATSLKGAGQACTKAYRDATSTEGLSQTEKEIRRLSWMVLLAGGGTFFVAIPLMAFLGVGG